METTEKVRLRTICSWCGAVIAEGTKPTPVSNGICLVCLAEQMKAMKAAEEVRNG